jgi:hypothetical protein
MTSITAVRSWVQDANDANATYRMIVRDNNTGDMTVGSEFTGDIVATPQWVTVSITPTLIFEGDDIAILLQQWNSASTTDYDFPYDRSLSDQNDNFPGVGAFSTDNQLSSFRMDNTDADGTDRTTELDQIIPGTSIRFQTESDATEWVDLSVVDITFEAVDGWYNMTVLSVNIGPGGEPPVGARCRIQISIPTPVPTTYVSLPNAYASAANFSGYLSLDSISGGSYDDHGYGADAQYQQYLESDDWEIMALSSTQLPGQGGASRDGPSGNVLSASGGDHFWTRWLTTEKENLAMGMNRMPWPGGGGVPTWDDVFRIQQFVAYSSELIVLVTDIYIIREVNWLETIGIIGPGRAAVILAP